MVVLSPEEKAAIIREESRKMGRLGGLMRAKNMTADERRKSAIKASKAAARARKKKARERKRATAQP